jgi:MFS family permease
MLGVGTLLLALVQASEFAAATIAPLVIVGVVALVLLVLHERRAAEPMLPIRLWRNRFIAVASLSGLTLGAVLMGTNAFLPTYLQGVMGKSPTLTGLLLAIESFTWTAASIVAGRLMIRTSYRLVSLLGACQLVAGSAALIALDPVHGLAWAAVGVAFIGAGMGFCNTSILVSVQASVRWNERAVATSSTVFARIVGQAVGTATFGAILNAGLHRHAPEVRDAVDRLMTASLRATLAPSDLPRLVHTLGLALHGVWIAGTVLAAITLVLMLYLPGGIGARSPLAKE